MKNAVLILCLVLAPWVVGCATMKRPSGDPAKMSADTLCYRYAYGSSDPALGEEVRRRNLDCARLIEDQPQMGDQRY